MAHRSAAVLHSDLNEARQKVKVDKLYSHYKYPEKHYRVVDILIIEATDEIGVVYEAQYQPLQGVRFVRPLTSFLEVVVVEGIERSRFIEVE